MPERNCSKSSRVQSIPMSSAFLMWIAEQLDWLGVDHYFPYGLTALWPFSDRFYISGWDIFRQTARHQLLTWPVIAIDLKAAAQEIALVGPIVAALWLVRVKTASRLASEVTGRHHPAK